MRFLLLLLLFIASLSASEPPPAPAYPLWDNHESVADYAKRVNLPPTKTLDLGNGVKLELVLIPAGKFIMGTPPPTAVDEAGFHTKIVTAQACLAASAATLLLLLSVVLVQAIRKRRRPQLSLGRLLLVTVATGGCVLSGLHWRQSADGLQAARLEYAFAELRFTSAEHSEKPAHAVALTQPFYMGKYVVTQEQYQQLVGTNPSQFNGKENPVERVSWNDANVFCRKATAQTEQTVRLPTEAEWEYGCRAGTTTEYYFGDTENNIGLVAWHFLNSKFTTHPVGQKEANVFGLFDMHGNVWQWCQDRFDEDYYSKSPTVSPKGPDQVPDQSASRVLRGGSWGSTPMVCRSARRFWDGQGERYNSYGFRVVVAAPALRSP